MKIIIGKFDPGAGTVPVTFSDGEKRHARDVRAVLVNGQYDADATRARIDEVGAGVVEKWALGLLCDPSLPEPDAHPAAE
ncbi:hypothetical protein [Novosphingobium huizhouense]|uniref:hypothetical protein n=1 Tax=Novosphingobium huizhouense TaxID=2866625 RepID=UPI001CD9159B|nr:hypothetical protein [Novosphingobium huizhouense]